MPHPLPELDALLRTVARRYRVPPVPNGTAHPLATLAATIEHARIALARGEPPGEALKQTFLAALARAIRDAMRVDQGDPAVQAMVLRHQAPIVDEYAALSTQTGQDARQIRATVARIAHPAKRQRMAPGPRRDALGELDALAASASWSALADTARRLRQAPGLSSDAPLAEALDRLVDDAALDRLQRRDALSAHALVRQYQALWTRQGPRAGSAAAATQGELAQRRGAAVETLAAGALDALAARLNVGAGTPDAFRAVTSMRVPGSIATDTERAKTEWDVVLLRQAGRDAAGLVWDVCLLVEAKASADAAASDLPRLVRGLKVLASAGDEAHVFATRQGDVRLRGASLRALPTEADGVAATVMYCSDAPADASPRLLGTASRMQLFCAPAGLDFAERVAAGETVGAGALTPIWDALLASPAWSAVLHQYLTLRRARALMVHVDDLTVAIARMGRPG